MHKVLLAVGTAVLLLNTTQGASVELEPGALGEGRLKFRGGPVCMCAGGLSEKDIRTGDWIKRNKLEDSETEKPMASDNKQEEE